jgi:hypothetical protein
MRYLWSGQAVEAIYQKGKSFLFRKESGWWRNDLLKTRNLQKNQIAETVATGPPPSQPVLPDPPWYGHTLSKADFGLFWVFLILSFCFCGHKDKLLYFIYTICMKFYQNYSKNTPPGLLPLMGIVTPCYTMLPCYKEAVAFSIKTITCYRNNGSQPLKRDINR